MLALLVVIVLICSSASILRDNNTCNFQNCGDCIGNEVAWCVWCLHDQEKNGLRRCQTRAYANENQQWCPNIYDPPNSIDNVVPTDKHMFFQSMNISARPGVPISFNITHTTMLDYPLDVYYLMDLSYSTKEHRLTMNREAFRVYSELSALSTNVRIGLGTFIDKAALPYVSPDFPAYSFKNHVPLTDDINEIKNILQNSEEIENNDDQEAGLDALMQAIVCRDEVGWRKEARHVIIFCTDDPYHVAGDGKMVGAIKPNDMKCHLQNNTHVSSLEFDYPSVSQINKVVMDNNVTVVFAATKSRKLDYMFLAESIEGAKYVELDAKTSNIADLIIQEYKDLIKSVQIRLEAPSYVNYKVSPNCLASVTEKKCYGNENNEVKFNITIKVNHCPKPGNIEDKISITALGLHEVFEINLKAICHCDCEKHSVRNAAMCNDHGSYECGICKCNEDRYGDKCQCKGVTTAGDFSKCKDKSNNLCSGRGICRCGECICQGRFTGTFCENDPTACPIFNGQLCAGHGRCRNERCQCDNEWTGDDCRCPDHDRGCYAPHSTEICSGNGECICGECRCNKSYSGIFCDDCQDCKVKRCKEVENYAECNFMKKQVDCIHLFNEAFDVEVQLVNKTEFNTLVPFGMCEKVQPGGDKILFYFQYKSKKKMLLLIQNSLDVPPKVQIWVIIGSIIGSILLVGLVTCVIWKITIDYHDYIEYKKFEEEANKGDLCSNPIYKEPCVQYRNPNFKTTEENTK